VTNALAATRNLLPLARRSSLHTHNRPIGTSLNGALTLGLFRSTLFVGSAESEGLGSVNASW
jgi:hypothetical protein